MTNVLNLEGYDNDHMSVPMFLFGGSLGILLFSFMWFARDLLAMAAYGKFTIVVVGLLIVWVGSGMAIGILSYMSMSFTEPDSSEAQ